MSNTLAKTLGTEVSWVQEGVQGLLETIAPAGQNTASGYLWPRACFQRWSQIFSIVYGPRRDDPSPEYIFALHTYYALFLKLLAAKTVSLAASQADPVEEMAHAADGDELRRRLQALEDGDVFRRLKIANFLDGDSFGWLAMVWSAPIERLVREMAARLHRFGDPSAADTSRDSGNSRDGPRDRLQDLYHELLPKKVRRRLGEYYTPDWLVDHVLDAVGFEGQPHKRVLDPACGSGAFLLAAIERVRHGNTHTGREELGRQVLANICGLDLNPLAVLASRVNYLLALGNLLPGLIHSGQPIEIPVYCRDSILNSSAQSNLPVPADYVVGNPPWVAWDHLPAEYRQASQHLWRQYGLFTLSSTAARHGGAKKDLSTLMLYKSADAYLRRGGRLAFVMTQTVFQSKGAGQGFRRFQIGQSGAPLCVLRVDDMVRFQPFPTAANWTSVIVLEKGKPTQYPVDYFVWSRQQTDSNNTPGQLQQERHLADPIDPADSRSPWLIRPSQVRSSITALVGPSDYQAHLGANSGGANGVYWLRVLQAVEGGVKVQNVIQKSKTKISQVEQILETKYIYPLLCWADVRRWTAAPSRHILLVQDIQRRTGIDEEALKQTAPNTWAYLKKFEKRLRRRAAYRRYQPSAPFYSMYDIDGYTLAPVKVVWRRMDRRINAAVVQSVSDPYLGPLPVVPQETCVLVEAASVDEAHYLCAVLNSAAANFLIQAHSVRGGKGFGSPSMLDYLPIRRFDPAEDRHQALAALSLRAHDGAAADQPVEAIQAEIDLQAGSLWNLAEEEIKAMRRVLTS